MSARIGGRDGGDPRGLCARRRQGNASLRGVYLWRVGRGKSMEDLGFDISTSNPSAESLSRFMLETMTGCAMPGAARMAMPIRRSPRKTRAGRGLAFDEMVVNNPAARCSLRACSAAARRGVRFDDVNRPPATSQGRAQPRAVRAGHRPYRRAPGVVG